MKIKLGINRLFIALLGILNICASQTTFTMATAAWRTTATASRNLYNAMPKRAFHDALGVGENATKAEVQAAYRNLAKLYHPDINKRPEAAEMMKKINNARDEANTYFNSDAFKSGKTWAEFSGKSNSASNSSSGYSSNAGRGQSNSSSGYNSSNAGNGRSNSSSGYNSSDFDYEKWKEYSRSWKDYSGRSSSSSNSGRSSSSSNSGRSSSSSNYQKSGRSSNSGYDSSNAGNGQSKSNSGYNSSSNSGYHSSNAGYSSNQPPSTSWFGKFENGLYGLYGILGLAYLESKSGDPKEEYIEDMYNVYNYDNDRYDNPIKTTTDNNIQEKDTQVTTDNNIQEEKKSSSIWDSFINSSNSILASGAALANTGATLVGDNPITSATIIASLATAAGIYAYKYSQSQLKPKKEKSSGDKSEKDEKHSDKNKKDGDTQ